MCKFRSKHYSKMFTLFSRVKFIFFKNTTWSDDFILLLVNTASLAWLFRSGSKFFSTSRPDHLLIVSFHQNHQLHDETLAIETVWKLADVHKKHLRLKDGIFFSSSYLYFFFLTAIWLSHGQLWAFSRGQPHQPHVNHHCVCSI